MNIEYFEARISELDKEIETLKNKIEQFTTSYKSHIEQMLASHNMLIGQREENKRHLDKIKADAPASEPVDPA